MGQWIGFVGPDMMRFIWHSESIPPNGANRGYYLNPDFDALLDKAREELNETTRNALYKEAQLLAENDFVYLGLWHPNISWIKKKCITGLKLYPNGGFLGLKNLKNTCR
jgi:peptide/nickel transport system substrate-binding protein